MNTCQTSIVLCSFLCVAMQYALKSFTVLRNSSKICLEVVSEVFAITACVHIQK
jgi:hypothetical protein